MSRSAKVVVLDSWAVMAYFQDEPPAAAIQKILVDAQEGRAHIVMTVINAGEIWYIYMRRASEQIANERIQQLRMAGVEFVDADWALTKEAARLKSRHAIAYADCFAAALAKREQGRLVTGDREFTKLEKLISITWI